MILYYIRYIIFNHSIYDTCTICSCFPDARDCKAKQLYYIYPCILLSWFVLPMFAACVFLTMRFFTTTYFYMRVLVFEPNVMYIIYICSIVCMYTCVSAHLSIPVPQASVRSSHITHNRRTRLVETKQEVAVCQVCQHFQLFTVVAEVILRLNHPEAPQTHKTGLDVSQCYNLLVGDTCSATCLEGSSD